MEVSLAEISLFYAIKLIFFFLGFNLFFLKRVKYDTLTILFNNTVKHENMLQKYRASVTAYLKIIKVLLSKNLSANKRR